MMRDIAVAISANSINMSNAEYNDEQERYNNINNKHENY